MSGFIKKIINTIGNGLSFFLATIMSAFAAVGILMVLGPYFEIGLFALFVLVPIFFLFVIFVHEMGHAIGAWLVGYKVHIIVVGVLGFDPENKKFRIVKDKSRNEIAGFVSSSPKWPLSRQMWKEIWVSFAGPLATILMGVGLLKIHWDHQSSAAFVTHPGYLLLAIVCFLDAGFNLFPKELSEGISNDGKSILTSLSSPKWTDENWIQYRYVLSEEYNQEVISKEEWLSLRQSSAQLAKDEQNSPYWRHLAWERSDTEAFTVMAENIFPVADKMPRLLKAQYIASRILSDRYDPELDRLMPDISKEEEPIYFFAKALLDNASENFDSAIVSISQARKMYIEKTGNIPIEEDDIFKAIQDRKPVPKSKWPPLA